MATYLVTGGAGFIGSHIVERLLSEDHRVLALDNLSTGSRKNLEAVSGHPKFEFVEASVCNQAVTTELVTAADAVFHLAASVGVELVMNEPLDSLRNNVCGTDTILRAAEIRKTKVILTSTSEVYGTSKEIPYRESGSSSLGSPDRIRWGYAAGKLLDEFAALSAWHQHALPVVIVRLFNTIGPRQIGTYGMVVPRLIGQALDGRPLTIYGTGEQTRSFVYVSDIVEWYLRLANLDSAVGEVFNLGNPNEISINRLAERILKITGPSAGIRYVPYESVHPAGFEDTQRRVPCIDKVVQTTGHAPAVPLDSALGRIHTWLRGKRRAAGKEISLPTAAAG